MSPRLLPRLTLAIVAAAALLLAPASTSAQSTPAAASVNLALTKVIDGLKSPVQMVDANDGTGRFFIVEKTGKVLILKDGKLLDTPLLDISDHVSRDTEQGLLSIALHPSFSKNGLFFIDYTDTKGNIQIERWSISKSDANVADSTSKSTLLSIQKSFPNHNGGLLLFGPDGKLYIGVGDGGSEGDPHGNGQNLDVLFGKILRIDVDSKTGDLPYGIPKDNPFANTPGARGEIWDYGLRNPWRFSFDKKTGYLLIGDVGQDLYEEADFDPLGKGGINYGWKIMEARSCYKADSCDQKNLTLPFFFYGHENGACAITGGYIYRGTAIKGLDGVYLAADYCSGELWQVHLDNKGGSSVDEPMLTKTNPSSFAEDAKGELYLIDLKGAIYKITG